MNENDKKKERGLFERKMKADSSRMFLKTFHIDFPSI
jgi:hypothetical protein